MVFLLTVRAWIVILITIIVFILLTIFAYLRKWCIKKQRKRKQEERRMTLEQKRYDKEAEKAREDAEKFNGPQESEDEEQPQPSIHNSDQDYEYQPQRSESSHASEQQDHFDPNPTPAPANQLNAPAAPPNRPSGIQARFGHIQMNPTIPGMAPAPQFRQYQPTYQHPSAAPGGMA